jgi:hypothetical protein
MYGNAMVWCPYKCYFKENPQKALGAAPSDQAVHGLDACNYKHKFSRYSTVFLISMVQAYASVFTLEPTF